MHGARPLQVSVTPGVVDRHFYAATSAAEAVAADRDWTGDILVVGSHPLPAVRSWLRSDPPAGLLGQYVPSGWHEPRLARDGDRPMPKWARAHWDWDAGLWLRCATCGQLGVYHEMRKWDARPCGHREGPWHLRGENVRAIGQAWAEAAYSVSQRRSLRHKEGEPV